MSPTQSWRPRVVQELADRDALSEGRGIAVEVEQALRNELKDERSNEDLRHASDAEAVIDCERLAPSEVCEPSRCLDACVRTEGYGDCARDTGRDDGLKLILDGLHPLDRQPNAGAKVSLTRLTKPSARDGWRGPVSSGMSPDPNRAARLLVGA
jgi:hypothetical protein